MINSPFVPLALRDTRRSKHLRSYLAPLYVVAANVDGGRSMSARFIAFPQGNPMPYQELMGFLPGFLLTVSKGVPFFERLPVGSSQGELT